MKKRFVFAMTGATCQVVGLKVLRALALKAEVHLVITSQSFGILRQETGLDWSGSNPAEIQEKVRAAVEGEVYYHAEHDLAAPVSSGSFRTDGMFVVPCSMKTLAGIAHGYTENLVQRAADVTLKEGRPLLLSPREMPFSAIHLDNMLTLARLGVRIAPPVLSFYHTPESMDDLVGFVAGKILDAMGIDNGLYRRWS